MPKSLLIISIVLLLGSWFVIGDKKSFSEKVTFMIVVAFLYISFRLLNGASIADIFAPLLGQ